MKPSGRKTWLIRKKLWPQTGEAEKVAILKATGQKCGRRLKKADFVKKQSEYKEKFKKEGRGKDNQTKLLERKKKSSTPPGGKKGEDEGLKFLRSSGKTSQQLRKRGEN